jgi:acetylornithine aminotransferase
LYKHKIFTGEAKPNVIRLLPSLALTKNDANKFLKALKEEVAFLISEKENVSAVNA